MKFIKLMMLSSMLCLGLMFIGSSSKAWDCPENYIFAWSEISWGYAQSREKAFDIAILPVIGTNPPMDEGYNGRCEGDFPGDTGRQWWEIINEGPVFPGFLPDYTVTIEFTCCRHKDVCFPGSETPLPPDPGDPPSDPADPGTIPEPPPPNEPSVPTLPELPAMP